MQLFRQSQNLFFILSKKITTKYDICHQKRWESTLSQKLQDKIRKLKKKVQQREKVHKSQLSGKFTTPLYREMIIHMKENIKRHPIRHGINPHQYGLEINNKMDLKEEEAYYKNLYEQQYGY